MTTISFEWKVVDEFEDPILRSRVCIVRETACSSGDFIDYKVPRFTVENFIKARREQVHREAWKHNAVKIITN